MIQKKYNGAAIFAAAGLIACGPQVSLPPVQPMPDVDSPIAKLYVDRCGRCHGAPNPGVHIAKEWPPVLHRMQNRMAQKGVKPLSTDEFATLLEYLQKYARGAS